MDQPLPHETHTYKQQSPATENLLNVLRKRVSELLSQLSWKGVDAMETYFDLF